MKNIFKLNSIVFTASTILVSFAFQTSVVASTGGRLVVFADKKEGNFKTDKSIRAGSHDDLQALKTVGTEGVHACFIGSPENIKPILNGMITNENKTSSDDLKLKTFETPKGSQSINLEVTSEAKKSVYLQMKIDPC